MADGLCVQGTARRENNLKVKDNIDLLNISNKDCMKQKGLTNVKTSFYICSDSGELCSNYRVNGVLNLGVHATDMLCSASSKHVEYSSLCPNGEDNCRKKRCADRYDSSESSDSGVATLSCTDCSASSSSSGTSDITEPGSPYSPASTHSSNCESGDDASPLKASGKSAPPPPQTFWPADKMAPNVPSTGERADSASWPWTDKEGVKIERDRGPPPPPPPLLPVSAFTASLKRQTAAGTDLKTASGATSKRLKLEHNQTKIAHVGQKMSLVNITNNNNGGGVKTSQLTSRPQSRCCSGQVKLLCNQKVRCADNKNGSSHQTDGSLTPKIQQQGKITEYFKTQMKPLNCAKKEIAALVAKSAAEFRSPSVLLRKAVRNAKTDIAAVQPATEEILEEGVTQTLGADVPEDGPRPLNTTTPSTTTLPDKIVETASDPAPGLKKDGSPTGDASADSESSSSSGVGSGDSALCISVATPGSTPSLPSPILSVPRTIRFPALQCAKTDNVAPFQSADTVVCRWTACETHFETSTGLIEHLQINHVNPQVMCENYVCLWASCKVFGRTSCSRSWLERHVLSHGGNKPFCCIVDGCGQRFSSQTTLERHVNSHFNQAESGSSGAGAKRNVDCVPNKLFRRNGKKLRYRRQPWSARMFDYFDSGIMEGLQYQLVSMTEKRTLGNIASAPGNTISLHSKVIARRVELDGRAKVLLRWFPGEIMEDEWVLESEAQRSQTVSIRKLSSSVLDTVEKSLFPTPCRTSRNRRKQGKVT